MEEIIQHFSELPPSERADAYEQVLRNLHAEATENLCVTTIEIETFAERVWQGRKLKKGK